MFLGACTAARGAEPAAWPDPPAVARVWHVPAEAGGPESYRLLIVPGSGCPAVPRASGDRWRLAFPGASVWVLQKPWLDPSGECTPEFAARDRLSHWQQAALAALPGLPGDERPWVVLALSEGAEIAPALVEALPGAMALLTVGASGRDPADVAELLYGQDPGWQRLRRQALGPADDRLIVDGRSLGYWRDLLAWRVEPALRGMRQPWVRVWGDHDELIPAEAYAPSALGSARHAGLRCDWPVPGGDHALQGPRGDGFLALGRWLLARVREGGVWRCDR